MRHTRLYRRLDRLKTLTGVDPPGGPDRHDLDVALRLAAFRGAAGSPLPPPSTRWGNLGGPGLSAVGASWPIAGPGPALTHRPGVRPPPVPSHAGTRVPRPRWRYRAG
ncbi:hypothetical protein [Streptomyces sp. NPDC091215]|uniref:hypothetical protein n=1 Tax=Streptomyces sp. NPDC091215 TaxID=3155192 RepID=UPI003415AFFA